MGLPSGHYAGVITTLFSNNGKLLLTTSYDTKAVIWEIATGRSIHELNHFRRVTWAEFSHSSNLTVTGSWNGYINLWNSLTGKLLYERKTSTKDVLEVHFSKNDKYLVSIGLDSTAKLWEVTTGDLVFQTNSQKGAITAAFFFKNDKMLATAAEDGSICFWEIPSGKLVRKMIHHNAPVTCLISNEKEGEVLSSSMDSTIVIWSFEKNSLINSLRMEGPVTKIESAPDKKMILIVYNGNQVALFNKKAGVKVWDFKGHTDIINSAVFNDSGSQVLTSAMDNTARIWDVNTGKQLLIIDNPERPSTLAAFLPNNNYFIASDPGTRYKNYSIYDSRTGELVKEAQSKTAVITSAEISPSDKFIVSTSADHMVRIWDLSTGNLLRTLSGHSHVVLDAAFSKDEKIIASVAHDMNLILWDANSGKIKNVLKGHSKAVRGVSFSPDNKKTLTVSGDSTAILWDYFTGEKICQFVGHRGIVQTGSFHPDGNKIITTSQYDSSVILWDIHTQKPIKSLKINSGPSFATFNTAGNRLLVGGRDSIGYIFDVTTFERLYQLKGHNTSVMSGNFDSKRGLALTATQDGYVFVWDNSGILIDSFYAHATHITSATVSGNSKIIVTSSYDDKIKIWNTGDRSEIMTLVPITGAEWVSILPTNFYSGSPEAIKFLYFIKGLNTIGFEQLDIKYNRPDKVLEAIGNTDTALIKSYRKAWEKRIKKLGIDTTAFRDGYSVPEADFVNRDAIEYEQRNGTLQLHIKGLDSTYQLDRFNVWVNEAPIFGQRGISIRKKNNNSIDTTLIIKLSQGENRIETSITNVNGTESYRMPLIVNYTPAIRQKESLRFIGIGIDKFADPKNNLQYSSKDIRDLSVKLKAKYGDDVIIDTLFNENVTISNVKALKQKLQQTSVNDKVIISYSGHGLLSKEYDYFLSTYSINFDKPEENGLPYDELENLLDSIQARKKLMLIDACHSGEVDKEEIIQYKATEDSLKSQGTKGGELRYTGKTQVGMKNSFELMQSLFVNVGKSTGATIISAAAGTQFALERGDLKNGVFTYSILEAMDKNPTMKISELKKIVGERVEQLTNGLQKPTSRNETIAVDWSLW